jgi:magnesium chelatase family protein
MAVARVYGAQPSLMSADIVTLETDLSRGLYAFAIVGLPGKAVEEARDRISSAIKNTGLTSPKSENHKVVISLAPADLKKEGPLFDLPMAISYLIASEEISADVSKTIFIGELSLDGELRPVRGVLPIVRKAKEAGFSEVVIPLGTSRKQDSFQIFALPLQRHSATSSRTSTPSATTMCASKKRRSHK